MPACQRPLANGLPCCLAEFGLDPSPSLWKDVASNTFVAACAGRVRNISKHCARCAATSLHGEGLTKLHHERRLESFDGGAQRAA
eukprot:scaffold285179_cov27-Tisochrysis_lutea.AAC.1